MNFPLQYFTSDYYYLELHEIYQMVFDAHYGRFVGMNHSGTREQFLERGVG